MNSTLPSLYLRHSSFSNPSVASPTLQLIFQPFFRFSYVTGSSLTSPGEAPMFWMTTYSGLRNKIENLVHFLASGNFSRKVESVILLGFESSINLNMASISVTGNVQPVFNLDPSVTKNLWCDSVDSSINYFLYVCQITYRCPLDLVLNKPPQEKWDVFV